MFKIEKRAIIFVCSAGTSISLLVAEMQRTAETKGMGTDISAVSAPDANNQLGSKNVDVLLLGPQVRFIQNQFAEKLTPKDIPLDVVNMTNYGMTNGEEVFDQAEKLINK